MQAMALRYFSSCVFYSHFLYGRDIALNWAASCCRFRGRCFQRLTAKEFTGNFYRQLKLHLTLVISLFREFIQVGQPTVQHVERMHHVKRGPSIWGSYFHRPLPDRVSFKAGGPENHIDVHVFLRRDVEHRLPNESRAIVLAREYRLPMNDMSEPAHRRLVASRPRQKIHVIGNGWHLTARLPNAIPVRPERQCLPADQYQIRTSCTQELRNSLWWCERLDFVYQDLRLFENADFGNSILARFAMEAGIACRLEAGLPPDLTEASSTT